MQFYSRFFSIDGFSYAHDDDREEDNIKRWHYIVDNKGQMVAEIDDSPYARYDEARFAEVMRRWDRKSNFVVMPRNETF